MWKSVISQREGAFLLSSSVCIHLPQLVRETGENKGELQGADGRQLRDDQESGALILSIHMQGFSREDSQGNRVRKKWSNL